MFYQASAPAQEYEAGGCEDDQAQIDSRYNLPRKIADTAESAGEEDDQIREMENLLAEIGADVSELKVGRKSR